MYPTPYRWTADNGHTHVLHDNHMPPSTGFGWSSLCNEVHLPIEGEHFELKTDATEKDVTCEYCQDRLGWSTVNLGGDSTACVEGCVVRFEKDEDGVLTKADPLCRDVLHDSLSFELDPFSGNLKDQVEEVCSECWGAYVDRQWGDDLEGAELCVTVIGEHDRSEYFVRRAETTRNGPEGTLRLVSENGLEKEIPCEDIGSISFTRKRHVNY